MNHMTDDLRSRHAAREATADGRLRDDMEATARLHLAAEQAPVDEALASVRWERRGLLRRLTRG